jgi:hypothetical protein
MGYLVHMQERAASTDPMVAALRAYQDGLTDAAFARQLGTQKSNWWMVCRGQRPLSRELLERAIRRYPGLLADYVAYLQQSLERVA